jgi:hypothetical protein
MQLDMLAQDWEDQTRVRWEDAHDRFEWYLEARYAWTGSMPWMMTGESRYERAEREMIGVCVRRGIEAGVRVGAHDCECSPQVVLY